jgi:hypothetical protein
LHQGEWQFQNILTARKIIRSKNAQCLVSTIEITPKRVSNIIENLDFKNERINTKR